MALMTLVNKHTIRCRDQSVEVTITEEGFRHPISDRACQFYRVIVAGQLMHSEQVYTVDFPNQNTAHAYFIGMKAALEVLAYSTTAHPHLKAERTAMPEQYTGDPHWYVTLTANDGAGHVLHHHYTSVQELKAFLHGVRDAYARVCAQQHYTMDIPAH